jgi:hypothetical protein
MTIRFTPQMPLVPGDSVWVGLPGFSVVGEGLGGERPGGVSGVIAVNLTGASSGVFAVQKKSEKLSIQ